jgi:hypothetical protein
MNCLNDLMMRIEALSDKDIEAHEPKGEVNEKEKVIGVLSKNSQKLFVYSEILGEKIMALSGAYSIESSDKPNEAQEIRKKYLTSCAQLEDERKIIKITFCCEVRNEFGIKANSFHFRKGWKIVEVPAKKKKPLELVLPG